MQHDAPPPSTDRIEPDLPYVEQQRALATGLLVSGLVITAVAATHLDPWWALPLVFAVIAVVFLAVWWVVARASSGSWLDAVERVAGIPGTERTSAARRSGLLMALGVLGIFAVVTLAAWRLTDRPSVGPLGALLGVGLGAGLEARRARAWEAEHGLRLYVRQHARRLMLTRAHQARRLVAAPSPPDRT